MGITDLALLPGNGFCFLNPPVIRIHFHPHRLSEIAETDLKEKDGNKSVLAGVPDALPSIIKAYRIQDKTRNVGFDWENSEDVWDKVHEEIDELKKELAENNHDRSVAEFGDFLFSMINVARHYHINPDTALEITNQKFVRRFNYIEEKCKGQGRELMELSLAEMDEWWNEAKRKEHENEE